MTVTFTSTFASARAAYSPANPPPMMTTCRGAEVISTAELEELPPPAGEAFDVPGGRNGAFVTIGGVHPPPEIGPVRKGEETRSTASRGRTRARPARVRVRELQDPADGGVMSEVYRPSGGRGTQRIFHARSSLRAPVPTTTRHSGPDAVPN